MVPMGCVCVATATSHSFLHLSLQINFSSSGNISIIPWEESGFSMLLKLQKLQVAQMPWIHLTVVSESPRWEECSAHVDKHSDLREIWASRWPWQDHPYVDRTRLFQEVPFGLSCHRRCSQHSGCAMLVKYLRGNYYLIEFDERWEVSRQCVCWCGSTMAEDWHRFFLMTETCQTLAGQF